jgi:hypothetical protein
MERIFREQPFCAMTMDGGQIHSSKLFITNIVVSTRPNLGITNNIETVGVMGHEILSKIVVANLDDLQQRGINISAITCDGASYQVKALDFKDPASIQRQNKDKPHLFKRIPMSLSKVRTIHRDDHVSSADCSPLPEARASYNSWLFMPHVHPNKMDLR